MASMTTLEIDVQTLSVARVQVSADNLAVTLEDGRVIRTPLWWYPRLLQAKPAERENYEIMPMGIHWPDLDEDLSVAAMLAGHKAPGAVEP